MLRGCAAGGPWRREACSGRRRRTCPPRPSTGSPRRRWASRASPARAWVRPAARPAPLRAGMLGGARGHGAMWRAGRVPRPRWQRLRSCAWSCLPAAGSTALAVMPVTLTRTRAPGRAGSPRPALLPALWADPARHALCVLPPCSCAPPRLSASSVQAWAGRRPHAARARGRGPARRRARGRADRLLLQRLRKSQSGTALYGDAQAAAEDRECAAEPSVYAAYEGAHSQRLIVVANRLPVSAFKDRDGRWALQARPRPRARPQRRRRPRRAACPLPGQGNPVPPGLRACAAAWAGRARCAHQRLRPRPSCGSARLPPAHEPAWAWEAAAGSCQACRCPAPA